MKKHISWKRMLLVLCTCMLLLSLVSCDSYSAVGLVRKTTKSSCTTEFYRLDGTLSHRIQKATGGEGELHYTASLEEGHIRVLYDTAIGDAQLLFELHAGESLDAYGGYIESGSKIRIIIETVEPSRGRVLVEAP